LKRIFGAPPSPDIDEKKNDYGCLDGDKDGNAPDGSLVLLIK
jgi:hypothetical protein